MDRPPEDPTTPILRGLVAALVLVIVLLLLTACAAPKPTFPEDMVVVCYRGAYYVVSPTAEDALRLPIGCAET